MNLIKRWKAKTPKNGKRLTTVGIILSAVSTAALGIDVPALIRPVAEAAQPLIDTIPAVIDSAKVAIDSVAVIAPKVIVATKEAVIESASNTILEIILQLNILVGAIIAVIGKLQVEKK
jgi:hypothetical protein